MKFDMDWLYRFLDPRTSLFARLLFVVVLLNLLQFIPTIDVSLDCGWSREETSVGCSNARLKLKPDGPRSAQR